MKMTDQIHARAQLAVRKYKACEVELIEVLELAEKFRVHTALGYSSLFLYATAGLGLSEEVAYININVARKAREVPALKEAIRRGAISLSKAKRISSVLNPQNQKHWLELAATLSKRELERMVAVENPQAEVREKATFISRDRVQLQVGVAEKFMLELRRAQDILSQKKRRPVTLEETLAEAIGQFVQRTDPVAKAKRQEVRGKLVGPSENSQQQSHSIPPAQLGPGPVVEPRRAITRQRISTKRAPIPTITRHKLNIQFNGQCAYKNPQGHRCGQRRFLDIHHIRPVSQGGCNNLHNLELLCAGHHKSRHEKREARTHRKRPDKILYLPHPAISAPGLRIPPSFR